MKNGKKTLEVRVTIPERWDAESFFVALFQAYADANRVDVVRCSPEAAEKFKAPISYEIVDRGLLVGASES